MTVAMVEVMVVGVAVVVVADEGGLRCSLPVSDSGQIPWTQNNPQFRFGFKYLLLSFSFEKPLLIYFIWIVTGMEKQSYVN